MTQSTLTATSWTKIASAGATVEIQNPSSGGVLLTVSSTQPALGADGEVLYGANIYRKYDAPLPADLYAIALTPAPTTVEVLPIGALAAGHNLNPHATPTVTVGTAYGTQQCIGGLLTFQNALDATQSGFLHAVRILSLSSQNQFLALTLFSAAPTASTFTDKAAPSLAGADLPKVIDEFNLVGLQSYFGTNATWTLEGINKELIAPSTTLYGVVVALGAFTFSSASDLTVYLDIRAGT